MGKNVPNAEHPFPLIKNIFRKVKNKSYYVLATRFVYQDEDFMIIDVIGKRFHVIEVANFNTSSFKLVPPIEVEQFEIKLSLNKCNHNNNNNNIKKSKNNNFSSTWSIWTNC